MAKFRITTPDGATYDVQAPDGVSQDEVLARVQAEHAKSAQPVDDSLYGKATHLLGGVEKGFSSPIPSVAELGARALDATGLTKSAYTDTKAYFDAGLNDLYGSKGMLAKGTNGSPEGKYGEVLGQIAATAPLAEVAPVALSGFRGARLLSSTLNSGLQGGGAAALTSSSSDEPLGDQVKTGVVGGGLIGGGIGLAGKALAAVTSPKIAPGARALLDEKIPLTIGQTLGGVPKRIEDVATSLPIVGDAINAARKKTTLALNRAALDRALAPIGESLPKDVKVGREGVDYVASRLGQKYDALLPKLSAQADPQFIADMQQIINDAQTRLPDQQYGNFKRIVESQLSQKAGTGTTLAGDTLKGVDSELSRLSSGLGSDPSFDNRELGGLIGDVHDSLRSMVARQNPQSANELSALNRGWANFARVRRAAASVGADDGVFTAPQLASAVKASDRSVGKGNYARGTALMQDLSDPARSILPSKVPDSGTAARMLFNTAGLGAGFANPAIPAGLIGGALTYSGPGQALLRAAVANRPNGAQALADLIRSSADTIAPKTGILSLAARSGMNY